MGIERAASPRAAGDIQIDALKAAVLVGGAVAAGAGVYLGSKALARRNGAREGRPVNAVLATAITACEVEPRDTVHFVTREDPVGDALPSLDATASRH